MGQPPIGLTVRDSGQIKRLQQELRRINSPATKKKYYSGLQRATKPMRAAAKEEALSILPKRGGLNRHVAGNKLATRARQGGVHVMSVTRSQARLIDRGKVRHPVFGNRDVWRTTDVPSGWFTRPMQDGAPAARKELAAVFDDVARDIARHTTT